VLTTHQASQPSSSASALEDAQQYYAGLSLRKLATLAGCSVANLSLIRSGKRRGSGELAQTLSRLIGRPTL